MGRKEKENLGKKYAESITPQFDGPPLAAARTGIAGLEIMLYQLLKYELDQLTTNADKRNRYLRHIFDPVAGSDYRKMAEDIIANKGVSTIVGYARQGVDLPCVAIILGDERTSTQLLADFVGETLEGEKGDTADYVGTFWDHAFPLWIYAEHPIVTVVIYQIVKMILLGANHVLEEGGLLEMTLSGTELGPNSEYVPENVFARVLQVNGKSVFTVPEFTRDPAGYRLSVHSDDVIVDGIRGGVHGVPPESGDD